MDKKVQLLLSNLTRENFPIVEKVPGWLEDTGIKQVLLIAPEDLVAQDPAVQKEIDLARQLARSEITNYEHQQRLGEIETQAPQALRDFLDHHYPEISLLLDDDNINQTAQMIVEASEHVQRFDMDITDTDNSLLIVGTSYADESKQELAGQVSGLESKDLENLPGLDSDWRHFVLAHEIGHGPQNPSAASLREEVGADLFATKIFEEFNDKAGGIDQVPDAFLALRAISSFSGYSDYEHTTNAAIQSGDEGAAPKSSEQGFYKALEGARNLTYYSVGSNIVSAGSYIEGIIRFLSAEEPSEGYGVVPVSKADEAVLLEMVAHSDKIFPVVDSEGKLEEDLRSQLSEDMQVHFDQMVAEIDMDVGMWVSFSNQPLFYEVTRQLYLDGAYDDNPIGKQYAYEFLVAVENHASKCFGVDQHEKVEFVPPEFDGQGQFVEPVKSELKGQVAEPSVGIAP